MEDWESGGGILKRHKGMGGKIEEYCSRGGGRDVKGNMIN
jgi:hypothetical protein